MFKGNLPSIVRRSDIFVISDKYMTAGWQILDWYPDKRYLNKEMVVMFDANIWPSSSRGWCGGKFLTNHHLSNFPSPRQEGHWGLWQSCDEAVSHQNQNHSTYFPRNNISCRVIFVAVRDSDLFAARLWIWTAWPELYFSHIVVCICVCCSHPWFITHLFLVLSNAARLVKAVDPLCRASQLSHCLWRDVDALWPQAADADLWVVTWCGFLPAASSRFLWRWLGGKKEVPARWAVSGSRPPASGWSAIWRKCWSSSLNDRRDQKQHRKYQVAWFIGLWEEKPQRPEGFCKMIDWVAKHWICGNHQKYNLQQVQSPRTAPASKNRLMVERWWIWNQFSARLYAASVPTHVFLTPSVTVTLQQVHTVSNISKSAPIHNVLFVQEYYYYSPMH